MVERLLPPHRDLEERSSSRAARYLLYAVGGLVLFAGAAALSFAIVQEEQKFATVYDGLGMAHLPKTIENMPYVQVELVRLLENPCNRPRVDALASSLSEIGQGAWAEQVRAGFLRSCSRNAPLAVRADATLASLIAQSPQAEIRRLAAQLRQNLCSRPVLKELVAKLQNNNDHQPVTEIGEGFLGNCTRDAMVGYWTMQSYFQRGNYTRSLALSEEFEKVEPKDAFWPYWKGRSLTELGRPDEAANAHLRSLGLWSRPQDVVIDDYWRTAQALKAAGRACEAKRVMEQYVSYDPDRRQYPEMTAAIAAFDALGGGCP